ncbi:MAG: porin [Idiomarinaceae bacterium]|uniref:Porin n=2 Tax=Pseudidiomarina aquimaris TaxID=641841 RepID=A0A432XFG7_9GAMM|nr:porin [Idiomarinaceae bacterium]RUO47297.1 porin [Pseudidiomarina aquimaris]|tara:strand:+ start:6668 stop:7618 length:951 start_codon:yes stop_codon:yes gene_type:complete
MVTVMTVKSSIWTVLPLTLLSGAAAAQDENPISFDFYGKANLSLQSNDEGDGSETELVSNASRIGVKGGTKLNDDFEVIYKLEWQVDLADLGGDGNLKSRNQYVGLKGKFGELTVGRRDTALKTLQGDIDQFSDYEADIKALFEGENRTSDTISYYSPAFADFRVAGSIVLSEDETQDDGYSLALTYGDEGLDDTPYYFGAGIDRDVDGYDIERLIGYTKVADTMFGLMWQQQQEVAGTNEADGFVASVEHALGSWRLKAQYQMMEFVDGDDDSIAFGADYKFSKNTKVYAWYTGRDLDTLAEEQTYIAIGLEHRF